jgi:transposase InsO family protein
MAFIHLRPPPGRGSIRLAKGEAIIAGIGDVCVGVGGTRHWLRNVLFVPGLFSNLTSVLRMGELGFSGTITHQHCTLFRHGALDHVLPVTRNGLFMLRDVSTLVHSSPESHSPAAFAATPVLHAEPVVTEPELWHARFAHTGYEGMAQIASGAVRGISVSPAAFRTQRGKLCGICVQARHSRHPFPSRERVSQMSLERLHMDVCGPYPVQALDGSRYFLTILDEGTDYSVVHGLTLKSQATQCVKDTIAQLETQTGRRVQKISSDSGGEFLNSQLGEWYREKGIISEPTAAYSPQQNGRAERLNRTLQEMDRAQRFQAGVPDFLWLESVAHANYLRNRRPTAHSGTKTPYECMFCETPDVSKLHIFGAPAWSAVPREQLGKLESRSRPGLYIPRIYLGTGGAGVRFLENGARRVVIRRDVMVNDHSLLRRAACRHVPPGLHVLDNTFGSGAIGENVMMPQAAPLLSAGVASAGPPAAAEVEAGVGSAEPSAAKTVVVTSVILSV